MKKSNFFKRSNMRGKSIACLLLWGTFTCFIIPKDASLIYTILWCVAIATAVIICEGIDDRRASKNFKEM
jgi:hypothetical protein